MSHGPLDTARTPVWADLVASALVGTDRRAPALPSAGGALGDLLGRLTPGDDPAGSLLGAAGAVAAYQRAGWLPPIREVQPFIPCPPDDLPTCSTRAGRYLEQILAGTHSNALPEWLAALATQGRAVPIARLPDLLERGRNEESLRPLITAVLGVRGRWLASLNPSWDYAVVPEDATAPADLTELWETGSRAMRRSVLSRLRGDDPARGRELLAATWASERVDERVAFLMTFEHGLSMADEPFLEQALDDRSDRVRKVASSLLARLPESGLIQRMIARLTPLLSWTPIGGRVKRPTVEVVLPEDCDAAMQRDGIVRKPISVALGERAWWLNQMLDLVPPSIWCVAWNASPNEIMEAKLPKEWRGLLLASWAEAARRHGDQSWLEALVERTRSGETKLNLSDLLPALSPDRREALVLELLTSGGPLFGDSPTLAALRSLPNAWSHSLARAVLAALRQRFQNNDKALSSDWYLRTALGLFAERIPADLANEAVASITKEMRELSYWDTAITQFEELLHFRDEMLRELRVC